MDIDKSIQLSFQYYQTGDLQQAKHTCIEILKEQPDNEAMSYLLGVVYAQLEEHDLAIQHLKKTLLLNINNADAYLALGATFQQKGLFDEAVSHYKRALEIDPAFAEAYENLGNIFRDKRQFDEAITYYKKALQYVPDSAEIHCALGNIFKEKRQLDLAMYYYRKALQYKPDYAEVCKNIGIIFHEQRRLDEAISYYEKAIQFNPNLADACINLGDAFHEKRKLEEAIHCYQDWSGFIINIGFIKVEMMINAIINQFYFKTLNIQFHPDVLSDENYTSGIKRRILENVFQYIKQINTMDRFFRDLDRLIVIRKYYANRHSGTMPMQNGTRADSYYKETDRFTAVERLHNEFMLTAANIEAQLVKIFELLCRFETVE